MQDTKISWTNVTWNPTLGCSRISDGCSHCYAEALSLRFKHTPLPWTAKNAAINVQLKPHKLREPYKLRAPSRIFVNSMSDLFHEQIPDSYIAEIFKVMVDCPQHTFQVLTKRAERMTRWPGPWPSNIWMGVSVENRREITRLGCLGNAGAKVKFVSFEPLLEDLGRVNLRGFDWVIVGGESGPGFRVMPHRWARNILDACLAQNVSFFFKQSAAWRTELGSALRHEDNTYWMWQQFPDELHSAPIQGEPHPYTYE